MKWIILIVGLMFASTCFIIQNKTAAEEPEGMPYEGYADENLENYTLFVGKWNHTCLTYSTTDNGLAELVNQALNLWGTVSPIHSCGLVSSGADIVIDPAPTGSLGPQVLGQAGCGSSGGFITSCHIDIATNGRFLGVVAHEVGHAIGLGHSQRSDQLMSAYCCNPLGFDDIAGVQSLYGSIPAITPTPTPTPTPVIYKVRVPGLGKD